MTPNSHLIDQMLIVLLLILDVIVLLIFFIHTGIKSWSRWYQQCGKK